MRNRLILCVNQTVLFIIFCQLNNYQNIMFVTVDKLTGTHCENDQAGAISKIKQQQTKSHVNTSEFQLHSFCKIRCEI